MSMESQVFDALKGLVGNRVFADFAEPGTARPFITYQAVGGAPINFTDGAIPDKEATRVQINVWADNRLVATTIGKQAEDALRSAAGLQTTVLTGRIATYDEATTYRGTMQDFGFFC